MNRRPKIKPIYIKSNQLISRIQDIAESMDGWNPNWFICETFRHRTTIDNAIKQWLRFVSDVASDANVHIVPIAAIDKDENGRVHIHAVLMTDRYVKNAFIHKNWKCGWEWSHLYDESKAGIPYILNHHQYIPVVKPFCPQKKKCRGKKGCTAERTNWNIASQALNARARGGTGDAAPNVDETLDSSSKPLTQSKEVTNG